MKPLLLLSVLAVLSFCLVACGGTRKAEDSAGRASPRTVAASKALVAIRAGTYRSDGYVNDGDNDPSDDDDPDDHNGKHIDEDNDEPEDKVHPENNRYVDKDDTEVVTYGRAATPADRLAIAALVRRYYATAAALDGAKACSMVVPNLAKSVVEDYGAGSIGPSYLRAGKNCPQVVSLLFKHFQRRFSDRFEITGVRVKGGNAYALLGSTTTPASYMTVTRERGAWKVAGLIGGPLP